MESLEKLHNFSLSNGNGWQGFLNIGIGLLSVLFLALFFCVIARLFKREARLFNYAAICYCFMIASYLIEGLLTIGYFNINKPELEYLLQLLPWWLSAFAFAWLAHRVVNYRTILLNYRAKCCDNSRRADFRTYG